MSCVSDAVLLNNIVQNFGMLDLVKKVLASHKSQMDRYREQYTRSLAGQYKNVQQSLHSGSCSAKHFSHRIGLDCTL